MLDLADRPRLGPYILTRELAPATSFGEQHPPHAVIGTPPVRPASPPHPHHADLVGDAGPERYLALHSSDNTSHVAYRFPATRVGADQRRFQAAAEHAAQLGHAHNLKIQQVGVDTLGHPWLITPFTGDVDGLRTLGKLLKEKGGQFRPVEVERTMDQLLSVSLAASRLSPALAHGPIGMEQVLVDRHGAVLIELYGLAFGIRSGAGARTSGELIRDEIRSIAEIGYQLLTGLRAEEPMIPAGRLVPKLDSRWDAWMNHALEPMRGFDSAEQALAMLPSRVMPSTSGRPLGRVRDVFSRLRV